MQSQKIKVGIYVAVANIKTIGEHDLIENTYGHRPAGIYLVAVSMIRDPRNPLSQADIDTAIQTMKNNFQNNYFSFKAKDIILPHYQPCHIARSNLSHKYLPYLL